MRSFLSIAGFELRTRLKRMSTWVYFVAFFAIAMLWTIVMSIVLVVVLALTEHLGWGMKPVRV